MPNSVAAVIFWSGRFDECVAFYRAVGLPLSPEAHDDSPVHFTCDLGDVHVAIYPGGPGDAPPREQGGATMIGFHVDSLDRALEGAVACGGSIVREPEARPWGRRAVVADPDGRSVELFE